MSNQLASADQYFRARLRLECGQFATVFPHSPGNVVHLDRPGCPIFVNKVHHVQFFHPLFLRNAYHWGIRRLDENVKGWNLHNQENNSKQCIIQLIDPLQQEN